MMDTKGLIQQGIWVVGGVMAVTIVMLGMIAWAHDGDVAQIIVTQFIDVIKMGVIILPALLGITQVSNSMVATKQVNAQANVQVAQAQASGTATPDPTTIDNGPSNG